MMIMNEMTNDRIFYVYAYLDPRKPGKYKYEEYNFDYEPFYIGKGQGRRIRKHIKAANSNRTKFSNNHLIAKIRRIQQQLGHEPITIKLVENLIEDDAYKLEVELINIIGRSDLRKGPLTNQCDGGYGSPSYKHTDEAKNKIREFRQGKRPSDKNIEITIARNKLGLLKGRRYCVHDKNTFWKLQHPDGKEEIIFDINYVRELCKEKNFSFRHLYRKRNRKQVHHYFLEEHKNENSTLL